MRRCVAALLLTWLTLLPGSRLSAEGKAPAYPDKLQLLMYLDSAGKEHAVKTKDDWATRRAHILLNMQEVMGPLPDAKRKVALDVKVTEEFKADKYIRRKLTFAVEEGDRLSAYLLIPTGRKGKLPAVLCLHPTQPKLGKDVVVGLGPKEDRAYAVHLAERGYVALAPDYLNSGDYSVDPAKLGYVSGTMKGIWNHMRAVDLLQALPEVDPARIGVIGHSLGGHNSMFVAAFDPRIKCAVSNCGFDRLPDYYGGKLAGWAQDCYMPRIRSVYDLKPEKVPFDFPEVVAALAPRAFLASAPVKDHNFRAESVKKCVAAAKPVYDLFGAGANLAANYPDCDHNFPPEVRKVAFAFLDRHLGRKD
jgi:dienelactone hydrolase